MGYTESTAELKRMALDVNIVEYAGRFLKLRRNGSNWFCPCVWHTERSASLAFQHVAGGGRYKCFGCGAAGDILDFYMRYVDTRCTELRVAALAVTGMVEGVRESGRVGAGIVKKAGENRWLVSDSLPLKTIPIDTLRKMLSNYAQNALYQYLTQYIPQAKLLKLLVENNVGTWYSSRTPAQNGAVTYWQVDINGAVRSCNVIHYDAATGRRAKGSNVPSTSKNASNGSGLPADVGSQVWKPFTQAAGYMPCLWGLHKLRTAGPTAVVGLVESEKTALLCSYWLPVLTGAHPLAGRPVVWMATTSMNGATDSKLAPLAGRTVLLAPDAAYTARAVWGLVTMRKKAVVDNTGREVLRMAADGAVDPTYVSVAHRLQAIGCTVYGYDPDPALEDSTDLADWLLAAVPPLA